MFLGVQGEGVHVDTISWGSGVVVFGLVVVKVRAFLNSETVVSVQLHVSGLDRVSFAIKSQTVVVRLGDSDILMDTVFSRVGRSVISGEIANWDRKIGQAESVSNINSVDSDCRFGTIGVRDNNSGRVKIVRKFNTSVSSKEREVNSGKQSVVAVHLDVGFVDLFD